MTHVLIYKASIHQGLASLSMLYFSYTVTMGEGTSKVANTAAIGEGTGAGPSVFNSRGKVSPQGSLQSSKHAHFVNVWPQLPNTASVFNVNTM